MSDGFVVVCPRCSDVEPDVCRFCYGVGSTIVPWGSWFVVDLGEMDVKLRRAHPSEIDRTLDARLELLRALFVAVSVGEDADGW